MFFTPTPAYLIKNGLVLTTYCPKCLKFGRDFEGEELAQRYGRDADLNEIAKRMVCSAGHRGAKIQTVPRAVPFTKPGR